MTMQDELIYGERYGDLMPGARHFARSAQPATRGRVRGELDLRTDEAVPIVRAILRAEAELLLDEAEQVQRDRPALIGEDRTQEAMERVIGAMHDAWLRETG